jgi:hypothetical protein
MTRNEIMGEVDPIAGGVRVVNLPKIHDLRGDLTPVTGGRDIPFSIARVYYLYNVPVDSERGGHAHKSCQELLIALSGSFRVTIDDGHARNQYWMRDPQKGLYVGSLIWRELDSFSQGAVSMVLASDPYDEADYCRDYGEFQQAVRDAPAITSD